MKRRLIEGRVEGSNYSGFKVFITAKRRAGKLPIGIKLSTCNRESLAERISLWDQRAQFPRVTKAESFAAARQEDLGFCNGLGNDKYPHLPMHPRQLVNY